MAQCHLILLYIQIFKVCNLFLNNFMYLAPWQYHFGNTVCRYLLFHVRSSHNAKMYSTAIAKHKMCLEVEVMGNYFDVKSNQSENEKIVLLV